MTVQNYLSLAWKLYYEARDAVGSDRLTKCRQGLNFLALVPPENADRQDLTQRFQALL